MSNKLCQAYPKLYPKDFGFACGDGWYHLIDVLSLLLTRNGINIQAIQVKEKFGTLRYYSAGCNRDEYTRAVTQIAARLSGITCDQCGAPAITSNFDGYIGTRCAACAKTSSIGVGEPFEEDNTGSIYDFGEGYSRLITKLAYMIDGYVNEGIARDDGHNITPVRSNGMLIVSLTNGDDYTKGLVDFINFYAARIDEHTGKILTRNKTNP